MPAKPAHHYLDLTRKDRRGTIVLLAIIALIGAVPFVYPLLFKRPVTNNINFDSSAAALQTKQARAQSEKNDYNNAKKERRPYDEPSPGYTAYEKKNKGALFSFDPNSISEAGWRKLGLRDKTIATIMNYRSKGGKFIQPDDIKKIWGLFPDEAERLIPYVHIEPVEAAAPVKKFPSQFSGTKKYAEKGYAPVNINLADTTTWSALPGIGSKLSQRIVSFREKLGGFYSVNQVAETFGLADTVFQKIKPLLELSGNVKKININTATIEEFKMHPYIRYQLGNAIIQYRTQHGAFKSIEDIKKIMIITEEIFNKLSPYLGIE